MFWIQMGLACICNYVCFNLLRKSTLYSFTKFIIHKKKKIKPSNFANIYTSPHLYLYPSNFILLSTFIVMDDSCITLHFPYLKDVCNQNFNVIIKKKITYFSRTKQYIYFVYNSCKNDVFIVYHPKENYLSHIYNIESFIYFTPSCTFYF